MLIPNITLRDIIDDLALNMALIKVSLAIDINIPTLISLFSFLSLFLDLEIHIQDLL